MVMNIMKNMESAGHYGSMFGQDVEPSGTYVLERDTNIPLMKGWVSGRAEIKNPLVVDVNSDTQIQYKYDLANKYKAKGKTLSKKIMNDGYDAIICKYPNGDSGEIVLLPNCNFALDSGVNESRKFIKNKLNEYFNHGKGK